MFNKSFGNMETSTICLNCEQMVSFMSKEQQEGLELVCENCGSKMIFTKGEWIPKLSEQQKVEALEELRNEAKSTGDYGILPLDEIVSLSSEITLTTTFTVSGRKIKHELEVISAECVYGMHMFKDIFASFTDFFGGRSKVTQDTLRDARRTALAELRREALLLGADAVIGVDLAYQEISGGGKNGMIMLVATGTAVKLEE